MLCDTSQEGFGSSAAQQNKVTTSAPGCKHLERLDKIQTSPPRNPHHRDTLLSLGARRRPCDARYAEGLQAKV